MIRRFGRAVCGLALSLAAPSASAADMRDAMVRLEALDARFQSIAWKLASGNAPFCADAAPAAGLLLYDVRNFAASDDVRRALGISGEIAIGAVARGSPAAVAGLEPGEELIALDGEDLARLPTVREGDTTRVDRLHDWIDAALARNGKLTLRLRDRAVTIDGALSCRARFELVTQDDLARSDGTRVQVSQLSLEETPDDEVLAALIAHELAHQVLDHAQRLNSRGRSRAARRAAEREADRLMPWLMINAGYDPAAALRWIDGWVRRRDRGWLGDATHDGVTARRAIVARELAEIAARRAAGQLAPLDWRDLFGEAAKGSVHRP